MRRVDPKVFLIGESQVIPSGLSAYLEHVGTSWRPEGAISGGEALVEVYGRLCYRSFEVGLNPNVTKVRDGNDKYIAHILNVKHGSVIEHPVSHWVFADVSRVFTHELVRHRAGCAYSQESLRFVRLTDLGLWLPPEFDHLPEIVELFETTFRSLEQLQLALAEKLGLDAPGVDFAYKKSMTSAMRRVAPIGLATNIGATFNTRALRHIITMRTEESAESEIRLVFSRVAEIAKERWPNFFQDFEPVCKTPEGVPAWRPINVKV
jgi:thymidylate synthase (FAD)